MNFIYFTSVRHYALYTNWATFYYNCCSIAVFSSLTFARAIPWISYKNGIISYCDAVFENNLLRTSVVTFCGQKENAMMTSCFTKIAVNRAHAWESFLSWLLFCFDDRYNNHNWPGRVLTALENLENSGKTQGNWMILREFLYIRCYFFVMQSETHNMPTYKFPQLQWYLYELLVVVHLILVDIIILSG